MATTVTCHFPSVWTPRGRTTVNAKMDTPTLMNETAKSQEEIALVRIYHGQVFINNVACTDWSLELNLYFQKSNARR